MQPSDSLDSFSRGFDSSCQRPTSWGRRLFCRLRRRLTHASANVLDPEIDHRLSVGPEPPEERQGPPGLLGRPLRTCRGATPRRMRLLLAPTSLREDLRRSRHRLRGKQNAWHPEWDSFRGQETTAHTLACLRFADLVTENVARLTTGSGGLTPGRARFAPAGRQTKFHEVIASSNPNRPAEPGRTVFPIPGGRWYTQWASAIRGNVGLFFTADPFLRVNR
jgi:hypothetical protein